MSLIRSAPMFLRMMPTSSKWVISVSPARIASDRPLAISRAMTPLEPRPSVPSFV